MSTPIPKSSVPTRDDILIAILSRRRCFTQITTRFRQPDQLWPATGAGRQLTVTTTLNVVLLILTIALAVLFGGEDSFTNNSAYQLFTLMLLTSSFLVSTIAAFRVFQDERERSLVAFIALGVSSVLFLPLLMWLLGVLGSMTEG